MVPLGLIFEQIPIVELSMVFLISRNLTSAERLKFHKDPRNSDRSVTAPCRRMGLKNADSRRQLQSPPSQVQDVWFLSLAQLALWVSWCESKHEETETLKSRWGLEDDGPNLCACHVLGLMFDLVAVSSTWDSLRGSSDKIGTIQRRLAWPLRKDDTHKSRSVLAEGR